MGKNTLNLSNFNGDSAALGGGGLGFHVMEGISWMAEQIITLYGKRMSIE